MSDLVETLPKAPAVPMSEWTLGELVRENGRQGALRLYEILDVKIGKTKGGLIKVAALPTAKLAYEAAATAVRICVRVAEGEMKARETDAMVAFLDRLNAERKAEEEAKGK
jgi:hypothetical protein